MPVFKNNEVVKKSGGPLDASVAVDWPVVHAMAVAVRVVLRCGDWHHAIVGMRNMCMSIVAMSGA